MTHDILTYDYTFMMADVIGDGGIPEAELSALQPQLDAVHQQFLYDKDNNLLGFAGLPYDEETALAVQSLVSQLKKDFDTLVILGIGGSDLGARALHMALNHTYYNQLPEQKAKLYFAGANTDPKELADLLDILNLSTTVICVISKSGDTIETMSAFVLFRERLIDAFGSEEAKKHFIVLTDADGGGMRDIVEREGYRSLPVPANVGGRYSVLSVVGLLPAAFVGIQIEELLEGAQEMDNLIVSSPLDHNPAMMYAALQYLAVRRGQHLSVLMPYGEGLRGVAQWYRQLWAESLGKKLDVDGKVVHIGPTPIAAVGSTDQHSQVQLYNEGPLDKVVTFVEVEEQARSLVLGSSFDGIEELSYLKRAEFGQLLSTERQATAMALARNGRPNGTLLLPKLDESSLGALLYFFEVACVYSAGLYRVNAFDQPGVESGKQAMYALLGRDGYEDQVDEWQDWLQPKKHYSA